MKEQKAALTPRPETALRVTRTCDDTCEPLRASLCARACAAAREGACRFAGGASAAPRRRCICGGSELKETTATMMERLLPVDQF